MMACFVNANAKGTYRGFFDAGPSITNGFSLDITTTHGYQFNQNWFLGAGTGLINIIESYNNNFDTGLSLPIFAKVRFDNLSEKDLTWFTEANIGCAIVEDDFPLYLSFLTGLRKRLTERLGLNFGIGFSLVPGEEDYSGYSSYSYYYYSEPVSVFKLNIKVGIDF